MSVNQWFDNVNSEGKQCAMMVEKMRGFPSALRPDLSCLSNCSQYKVIWWWLNYYSSQFSNWSNPDLLYSSELVRWLFDNIIVVIQST